MLPPDLEGVLTHFLSVRLLLLDPVNLEISGISHALLDVPHDEEPDIKGA